MSVKQFGKSISVRHIAAVIGFMVGFGAITFSAPEAPSSAHLRGLRGNLPKGPDTGLTMNASVERRQAIGAASILMIADAGVR